MVSAMMGELDGLYACEALPEASSSIIKFESELYENELNERKPPAQRTSLASTSYALFDVAPVNYTYRMEQRGSVPVRGVFGGTWGPRPTSALFPSCRADVPELRAARGRNGQCRAGALTCPLGCHTKSTKGAVACSSNSAWWHMCHSSEPRGWCTGQRNAPMQLTAALPTCLRLDCHPHWPQSGPSTIQDRTHGTILRG